jgi:hypothetical protein
MLTRTEFEPKIYRNQNEHANHSPVRKNLKSVHGVRGVKC